MKIFINSRLLTEKPTGIHNYIKNLYSEILSIDQNNSYTFIQPNANKTIGRTKVIKIPKSTLYNVLFDCFLVNKVLKKANKEHIIYHGASFILPYFKLKNVKYILTVYDLSFKLFSWDDSKFLNIYYNLFLRRSLQNADKIIAISKNTKKDIIKLYNIPKEKIEVTYLAGDKFYEVSDIKIKKIFNENYFLAVTTHPKRKNIFSVVKAMAKSEILKNYKFVIVGIIPENHRKEILNLAKKLGVRKNIHLAGYVSKEDLLSLYHYALFFIYPSFYEGFGLPVLESMMAKCPVITSNISSLPEVVPKNYQYLVDPYSIKDIRRKMEKMVLLPSLERDNLVLINYNFSKKFTWAKTAYKFSNILKKL